MLSVNRQTGYCLGNTTLDATRLGNTVSSKFSGHDDAARSTKSIPARPLWLPRDAQL